MLGDLDRLMEAEGLDALLVVGPAEGNADLAYLTRGASVSGGPVVKRRGQEPVLLVNPMEIEEARASGCQVVDSKSLDLDRISREAPDRYEAQLQSMARILDHFEIAGRVQFLGRAEPATFYHLLRDLCQGRPDLEPVAARGEGLLTVARMTKDAAEVEAIRRTGRATCRILSEIVDGLRRAPVVGGVLTGGGAPLTVGRVKARLRGLLAEAGLTDHGHTIFALGADGGYPHSRGTESDELRPGDPVVFDLFPQPVGGGYYFDITRSFTLGPPGDEYREHWDLVRRAFDESMATIAVGVSSRVPQEAACDVFEAAGHSTGRSDPKANVGYYHSLGHGLGLDIHEPPLLGLSPGLIHDLAPGMVFTVEPGLYYPDRGFGIRIEDTVWLDEAGRLENLTADLPIECSIDLSTA